MLSLLVSELNFLEDFLLFVVVGFRNPVYVIQFLLSLDQVHFFFEHQVPVSLGLGLRHHGVFLVSLVLNRVNSVELTRLHLFPDLYRVMFFVFECLSLEVKFSSFLLVQLSLSIFGDLLLPSNLLFSSFLLGLVLLDDLLDFHRLKH